MTSELNLCHSYSLEHPKMKFISLNFENRLRKSNSERPNVLYCRIRVKFHGKAAHASAFPWDGVNALDAAVLCYQNVSCMRQQLKPTWRIHGKILINSPKPSMIIVLSFFKHGLSVVAAPLCFNRQ